MASVFAETIIRNKYAHEGANGTKESWADIAARVASSVVSPYLPELTDPIQKLIESKKFMPGGRYLASAGRRWPNVNNCFLFRAVDTTEGWGELMYKVTTSLMSGGGIGVVYSDIREEGAVLKRKGGFSTGPCALMQMVNEDGRHVMQGGSRRSAIWAGLHWKHLDVKKFIGLKNWHPLVRQGKREDFNFPAPMDGTNISVILDDAFFAAHDNPADPDFRTARDVYWGCVRSLLETGEPGFSVDVGDNEGESLRNACCEVTSRDDSDMCNLGSLNLARFSSLQEFADAVPLATAFLLCGTLYSKLPIEQMYRVREKNRRLGLGLMGVHEWLLKRNCPYGPSEELSHWLYVYEQSGAHASRWADRLGCSRPVATRAVAPTGTISIAAETTSGIEPIFAVAYKRRYLDGKTWKAQYVVDQGAQRMIDGGVDPRLIEDAVTLAEDVERRMRFQAWVQRYVDHGISSTINLPSWGSPLNDEGKVTSFGNTLLKYLPHLRGITAYPDGSRDGQPLVRVPYEEAISQLGTEFLDNSDRGCKSGVCGE
jgi:ribonucleoside-diphosphate reductase alpha chain